MIYKSDWLYLDQWWSLIEPLFYSHYRELCKDRQTFKLNMDKATYKELDRRGRVVTVVAIDDGNVAGYSVNLLHPHLHYYDTMMCSNDLLYVVGQDPIVGGRLIVETRKAAKEAGAHVMTWHAKEDTPLEGLLRKRGKPNDLVFFQNL